LPPPQFLDTVVLLLVELIGSIVISLKFRLAVVASQMMRGQAPQIFFPRTATANDADSLKNVPFEGFDENKFVQGIKTP